MEGGRGIRLGKGGWASKGYCRMLLIRGTFLCVFARGGEREDRRGQDGEGAEKRWEERTARWKQGGLVEKILHSRGFD